MKYAKLKFLGWQPYFKLTETSFEKLEEDEVPKPVLDNLQPLQDQVFWVKNAFLEAVQDKIGNEQATIYEELFLKHSQQSEITIPPERTGAQDFCPPQPVTGCNEHG